MMIVRLTPASRWSDGYTISMRGQSGIYRIDVGGTYYYGQAADLYHREAHHRSRLNARGHANPQLQNAYDKYDEFSFKVVLRCETNELDRYEQFFLDAYQPLKKCANVCPTANSVRGRKHTDETRAKIGAAHKGRPKGPESIAKMRASKQKHTYLVTRTDGTQREYKSYGGIVEAYGISKSQVARLVNGVYKSSKDHGIVSVKKV